MENYCRGISKYYEESPEENYSYDTSVHHECSFHSCDAHYFDIDISIPFSPADTIPISSSNHDDSEDEFPLDLSICTAHPPSPNLCTSPAGNLFYEGQLPPLQLLPPPLEDIDIDITFPQSRDVPRVKIQFSKFIEIATKWKISLLGFRKSAKPSMDLQSPCTERAGTGLAVDPAVAEKNRSFTVKLKVVEVPVVSLFIRGNSKCSKRDATNYGLQRKSIDCDDGDGQCKNMDIDKKGAKGMIQKYVKKIKPLCVKISQRGNEKIRCGDLEKPQIANGAKNACCQGTETSVKPISFSCSSGNLKMAYKPFGKGKQKPSEMQRKLPNYSSDSTWMDVQSVIEGAIAHCKQSNYNH